MNCDEMKALIHDYIDGELDVVEGFEAHLNQCSDCRMEYQFIFDMVHKMNNMEVLEMPKTLHGSIMSQIEIEAKKKRSTSFKHNIKSVISVVAAAFLLVVVFAVVQPNQFLDKSTESIMMDTASDTTMESLETSSESVTEETVEFSRATGASVADEDSGSLDASSPMDDASGGGSSDMMGIMEVQPSEDTQNESTTIETEFTEFGILEAPVGDEKAFTGNDDAIDYNDALNLESSLMVTSEDEKAKQDVTEFEDIEAEESFNWLLLLIPGGIILLVLAFLAIKIKQRGKK